MNPQTFIDRTVLERLCDLYRIDTSFIDWMGHHTQVTSEVLCRVLASLGVSIQSTADAQAAMDHKLQASWRTIVPQTIAIRAGWTSWISVHIPHGDEVHVRVHTEEGDCVEVTQVDNWVDPRVIDGVLTGEATFELPAHLPVGYHTLEAYGPTIEAGKPGSTSHLIISPQRLELPSPVVSHDAASPTAIAPHPPYKGIAAQLYQFRTEQTMGIGDIGSLQDLITWGAQEDIDMVLLNPIHAPDPVTPLENSPYRPSSRMMRDPNIISLTHPMFGVPSAKVAGLIKQGQAMNTTAMLDRDATWALKREALGLLYEAFMSSNTGAAGNGAADTGAADKAAAAKGAAGKAVLGAGALAAGYTHEAFAAFVHELGVPLQRFATWSVLAQTKGLPWQDWPAGFQHPDTPEVAEFAANHADEIAFITWIQWVIDVQLAGVAKHGARQGLALGIMHDLAVGVHPEGADAWVFNDALAHTMSVGAPQDQYSQLGQNWHQPPWLPHALEAQGYAPWRQLIGGVLRHAGGLRIDHILGLFRLWWIPAGLPATQGTYVQYNEEAMLGVLAIEAARAGVVIVGEDLGTVPPHARTMLIERGMLGTSIAWFERAGEQPLHPADYRALCLASVNTHDLPPTLGFLQLAHVTLRHSLGMLTRPVEEERQAELHTIALYVNQLRHEGLLPEEVPTDEDGVLTLEGAQMVCIALHQWMAKTSAQLSVIALADLVGDTRPINQPGSDQEYPNWRWPLTDQHGDLAGPTSLSSPYATNLMRAFMHGHVPQFG